MWSSWDIFGDSLIENLSICTLAGGDSEVSGLPSAISRRWSWWTSMLGQ